MITDILKTPVLNGIGSRLVAAPGQTKEGGAKVTLFLHVDNGLVDSVAARTHMTPAAARDLARRLVEAADNAVAGAKS